MTTFTPEITTKKVDKTVEPTIGNLPPVGTRVRATLGENVLVGMIDSEETWKGQLISITFDGGSFHFLRRASLWLECGWQFEILGDAA